MVASRGTVSHHVPNDMAPNSKNVITYGVRKGTVPQRVRVSPGKPSLPAVAIGADGGDNDIVRSTSMERVAQGDPATMRAATRVNAEQVSKPGMREPTRPYVERAPTGREVSDKRTGWSRRGIGGGTHGRGGWEQHGKPCRRCGTHQPGPREGQAGPGRVADGRITSASERQPGPCGSQSARGFSRRFSLREMFPRLEFVALRTAPMPYRVLKLARNYF